jgi:hypothetical protein
VKQHNITVIGVILGGLLVLGAVLVAISYCRYRSEVRRFEEVRLRTAARVNRAARRMGVCTSVVIGRTPSGQPWYASYIRLSGERTNDKRLADLEGLADAGLVGLSLSGARITDEGLKSLHDLNDLKYLQLDGTNISDRGIENLLPLANLRQLDVSGTFVTQNAAELLQQLPHLEIIYAAQTELQQVPGVTVIRASAGANFIDQDLDAAGKRDRLENGTGLVTN